MSPPLIQIDTPTLPPAAADVVIIGGGIIGIFAGYYLARRGVSVAVIEKGRIGAEQSSRNWGWCRQQNRDERELPMASKAIDQWERFGIESGEDTGFNRCGLLYLSNDEEEIARWSAWGEFAKTAGVTTHMLDSRAASMRGQVTGRRWKGGVFSPTDGTADPGKGAPAVARAIMKLGGSVVQNCAVRGLEVEAGRVSAVITESGVIKTRTAVLAGGAWASSFCRQLGIRFPQASIRQSILSVAPIDQPLPGAMVTSGVSFTRRNDGRYALAISGRARVDVTPQFLRYSPQFVPMFAKRWRSLLPGGLEGVRGGHETLRRWRLDAPTPMEKVRILDPRPDPRTIRETHRRAVELLPELRQARITHAWAGFVDSTPDGVPAIGEVPELPGLILGAGFSGHGFGIGPGAGHLIADLASGMEPIVDARPYHPGRFNDTAWGKVANF
ncbi:NAD(P)/FAD-dependent oxidoreductase [Herbaspirillum rubrisubalbicans]|uniref:D-amino acid oxidase n=1 Tax=Herbaspirillum rubrisubalbicans TaxID=80842 RepID=A0ABX9C1V4_9BURK|nr:FAD-binding oxidoreductase [Herbaspirillum rubrisubalbicans]RAM64431.1 D-amino acid oxidase [Herbaspirillum rubrisubalbicans]